MLEIEVVPFGDSGRFLGGKDAEFVTGRADEEAAAFGLFPTM